MQAKHETREWKDLINLDDEDKQAARASEGSGADGGKDVDGQHPTPLDVVDEACMESFPGSDPPGYGHA